MAGRRDNAFQFPVLDFRVIDGDSVVVEVDVGFRFRWTGSVRLSGIDTPEINRKRERQAGNAAKEALEALLIRNRDGLMLRSIEWDKYGRVVGDLLMGEELEISACRWMVNAGLARRYDGGRRMPWSESELDEVWHRARDLE